jgi:hypothetical protein
VIRWMLASFYFGIPSANILPPTEIEIPFLIV